MGFCLIRCGVALAWVCCVVSLSSAEPSRRALTAPETAALREPIELGDRVYDAFYRYFDPPELLLPFPLTAVGVVTRCPTVDVLQVMGYIADSDMPLVRRYRVSIATIISKPTDSVLTMQTKFGEIGFDARGQITLLDHP
jgi:hypothetical protein